MNVNARRIPTIGESTMNTKIVWYSDATSVPQPAVATAAPARPPTSACDELVGRPRIHVTMSQRIAPTSAAKIPAFVSVPGCTTLEIVSATLVPKMRNATKLKNAAQATACLGVRTRVDTTVAIEFAASWNPLKKSNASATAMIETTDKLIASYVCLRTVDSMMLETFSSPSSASSSCSRRMLGNAASACSV